MSSLYNENGILKGQKNRINLLAIIVTILLLILIVRLFYLQIVKGGYYYKLAKDNATRVMYLTAPRGDILSRGGKIFVDNESSFNIAVTLSRVKKKKTEFKFLAGLMHKSYRKILQSNGDIKRRFVIYEDFAASRKHIASRSRKIHYSCGIIFCQFIIVAAFYDLQIKKPDD